MGDTYTCPYSDCGKTFLRNFELKKHKVTHENPDRVFYCPECCFITLQKKNLGIHLATHTGEKAHQCPDIIIVVNSVGSPPHEERCEYRTNDPAALTKHRKKVHGYIPPPNRSRAAKRALTTHRKSRKTKDTASLCHAPPTQDILTTSCPKPSCAPELLNSCSGAGYTSVSTTATKDFSPSLWQGNMGFYGQSMDSYFPNVSGYGSATYSSAMLSAPENEMDLNALYDPSLHPDWMAKYEMSYSMFDMTGMNNLPEPLPMAPPSDPATLHVPTDQEGSLCPERTVASRTEDWGQYTFNTRR